MQHVVYALCCPASGEIRYVGKTAQLARRVRAHIVNAKIQATTHRAKWLNSLQTAPAVRVLEECESEEQCSDREVFWIATLRTQGARLTNATDGGEGQSGLRHSEETKRKMAIASAGRRHTSETKARLRAYHSGKKWALGKKHGPEARERHRLAALGKGPFRGRRHSSETIEKMRSAHRGKPRSVETRAKIAAAKRGKPGRPHTEEFKQMMRQKMTGRTFSAATIERMTIAARSREARKRADYREAA